MTEPAVLAVIVNLVALGVHAGLAFYWAGRVMGTLRLIDHRLDEGTRTFLRLEAVVEAHLREHRDGKWSGA